MLGDGVLSCLVREVMSVGSLSITRESHNSEELATKGFYWSLGDTSGFRPGWIQDLSVVTVAFLLTDHPIAKIKISPPVLPLSQSKGSEGLPSKDGVRLPKTVSHSPAHP